MTAICLGVYSLISVGCGGGGLTDPKELGLLRRELIKEDNGAGGKAHDVAVNETHVFVSANHALVVIEKKDGLTATVAGRLPVATDGFFGPLAHEGNTVVTGFRGGFDVIDVSSPSKPTLVTSLDIDSNVYDLVLREKKLYALIGGAFVVYELADPAAPRELGRFAFPYDAQQGYTMGNKDTLFYFYLHDRGLSIVDASDPANPVQVSSVKDVWGESFARHGDHVYASGGREMTVVDISDPRAPTMTPDPSLPFTGGIAFYGDYFFGGGTFYQREDDGAFKPYVEAGVGFNQFAMDDRFLYLVNDGGLLILGRCDSACRASLQP